MTTKAPQPRRAVGIVRVSVVGGREGDRLASPDEQRKRIVSACDSDGLQLAEVVEELDVSGRTPLAKRDGLRAAIEAVERGEADVIVAAYFDRLVRSLKVQAELVERVEAAGGEVLALDSGKVTNGSAGEWLSATTRGMLAEYVSRTAKERSAEGQQNAIDQGRLLWGGSPPGYDRVDSKLVPNADALIVAEAFDRRDQGASVLEAQRFLASRGIDLSYTSATKLFRDRLLVGEIHFGNYRPNLNAHLAIVDRAVFDRVQKRRNPKGRRAKSARLLARLGVLRCASCGAKMVVGLQTQNGRNYPFYRCPPYAGECAARVTIGAEIAETVVVDAVKAALADAEGRASAETNVRDAANALERAEANLDAAISAFAGMEGRTAAVEKLADLRRVRDEAEAWLEHLGGLSAAATVVHGAKDWDRLTLDERRALIKATVDRAEVGPGRGADRITVLFVK